MKSQTLRLIEHLNQGGFVTRESAWEDFHIQNLTARISELMAQGYRIIKTPHKTALPDGRKTTITYWSLRSCYRKGDFVEVVGDYGQFLSLKGRIGVVEDVHLKIASATIHIQGVGYRNLKFRSLKKLEHIAPSTSVSIKPVPLVVLAYHPDVNSYSLATANSDNTIIASAALVEATSVTARC